MKKTYTKPEIEVSKFDVETVVTTTTSVVGVNLTAQIYNNGSKTAVAVVDYTKIFAK